MFLTLYLRDNKCYYGTPTLHEVNSSVTQDLLDNSVWRAVYLVTYIQYSE